MTNRKLERALRRIVDIRRDELGRVVPLAAAHGTVLASLYMLKPARNALFLAHEGVARLPWVLVLVAICGGVAAFAYARFASSERMEGLVPRTLLALAVMLLGLRLLLETGAPWVLYALYVWVNLYGLLATSLIWLLANLSFNSREARRLFGFIGTGGIVGAIIGGTVTGRIAPIVGTENLLIISALLLGATILLIQRVRKIDVAPVRKRWGRRHAQRDDSLSRSSLMRRLAFFSLLVAIVAVIVEIQFNGIVDREFVSREDKAAFFGDFFAYLSIFAFLFQLLLTPRILRHFGVIPASLILPVSLALGSGALLIVPGLYAALLLKIGDGGFRHSVHKSAFEVLFLPVPSDIKNRAKLFIDTAVDTVGTGLGAILVLTLDAWRVAPQHLGWVSIALITLALLVAVSLRRPYVAAIASALERRTIDPEELRTALNDASSLRALLPALDSENVRQLTYALDMLVHARSPQVVAKARTLLQHSNAEVRRRAVTVLAANADLSSRTAVEALLLDDDPNVRLEVINYLCTVEPRNRVEQLRAFLGHDDARVQSAALGWIAEYGEPAARALIDPRLIHTLLEAGQAAPEGVRAEVASAVAVADDPSVREHLFRLAEDRSPLVVDRTLESIGVARDPRFIPALIARLEHPQHRKRARQSLARFGEVAITPLANAVRDEAVELRLRKRIPRVLSEIHHPHATDVLYSLLMEAPESPIGEEALRALNRQRPSLRGSRRERVGELVVRRAKMMQGLQLCKDRLGDVSVGGARPSRRLLVRAIEEKTAAGLERIFRLLALLHRPDGIYNAFQGATSRRKHTRASAIEYLDNVLSPELKKAVLPLLEDVSVEERTLRMKVVSATTIDDVARAYEWLISCDDAWLRACAIFDFVANFPDQRAATLGRAGSDRDPIVRELAGSLSGAE